MWRMQDAELEKLLGFLSRYDEFVFLDTSRPEDENHQSLLFLNPVARLQCRGGDDLLEYLDTLQRKIEDGYHLAGWVGYEFGAILEGGMSARTRVNMTKESLLADFGVFLKPLSFNHHTGENDFPADDDFSLAHCQCSIENIQPNMAKEQFVEALGAVRKYIGAGDTYQVNYTMKLLFDFQGSAEKLYTLLRRNQSVAYGAFIRNGVDQILSFSPELFFRKRDAEITVRPMKGTAQRGRNGREDHEKCLDLRLDPKNRSENVMIVDLLRNDLARLMHGHGQSRVYVESLFDVESFESLLQMTSTVKAVSAESTMRRLRMTELFRALFPCGSITGAPKIRTMQIIDELEKGPRGVYTGAIGYFGPDGSATFSVPIRTVHLVGNSGEMGIGAGITYDSVPEEEWHETLLKGKFLTHSQSAFHLFETILWRPESGYWFLDEHLQRLAEGAQFFQFSCDVPVIRERLQHVATGFSGDCQRVRLALQKDGRVSVVAKVSAAPAHISLPIEPDLFVSEPLPLIDFSPIRVDARSSWCCHKTSQRAIYDTEYARAQAEGLYEYIFMNENGEVTEGCITNIIISSGGRYITPSLSSGLLPGVMRNTLLADKRNPIIEAVLTEQEIRSAQAIFLCNSVRGVVPVRMRATSA